MRMTHVLLATALALPATISSAQSADAQSDARLGKISNQYICTFDSSVARGNVGAETGRAVGNSLGQILHEYKSTIRGFAVRMPAQPGAGSAVAQLRRNNPKIAACEQDQYMKAFAGKPTPPPPAEATSLYGI